MKNLLIVDGNSILNRAFFGVRDLCRSDGFPTNALFGMANILHKHLTERSYDHAVIAFDRKAPTFRHLRYDAYKAGRKGMPEELAAQLPYAKTMVTLMGFTELETDGFEADDILGTVSARFANEDTHAYILTGDRDSLQLIGDHTTVLLATNKETIPFDRKKFEETYGIPLSSFIDLKALMGDSSDNIPGVPHVGEKTAVSLLQKKPSLEEIYENLDEVAPKGAIRQNLIDGKESAYLSRFLATIVRDVPIDYTPVERKVDEAGLAAFFREMEFPTLLRKFGLENVTAASNEPKATDTVGIPEKAMSAEEFSAYAFRSAVPSLFFTEDGVEVCDGNTVYTVRAIEKEDVLLKMRDVPFAVFDAKPLYRLALQKKMPIPMIKVDVMLGAYVTDATKGPFTATNVFERFTPETAGKPLAYRVAVLAERFGEENLTNENAFLLYQMEMPLCLVLASMEETGFKVDTDGIRAYGEKLDAMAEDLRVRICQQAGEEFNLNSPKQLGTVLFEKLGLPAGKKTASGYSTNADILEKLQKKYPIVADILEYRKVVKLSSVYVTGLLKETDENGFIHTTFNQTGTATGRLSSAEPNLQNIPVKTDLGRKFREFFIPSSPDRVLVDADYSQIELRLLAAMSGDESMIRAFTSGADIHTSTASKILGIPPEEVTPTQRKSAKAINFGLIYGMGEFSLAEDLGISRAEAKKYIDEYFAGFPSVIEYLDTVKSEAHTSGCVYTLYGRKRSIPEILSPNKNLQHFGERVAMNSPIQGTSADIIKLAMVRVFDRLAKEYPESSLILQVHDELMIDAPKKDAEAIRAMLSEEMSKILILPVPLLAEASYGNSWAEAK